VTFTDQSGSTRKQQDVNKKKPQGSLIEEESAETGGVGIECKQCYS
jgi:hypothetical protein